MVSATQKTLLSILIIIAVLLAGYFFYRSDFAFQLRVSVPATLPSETTSDLQCAPDLALSPGTYYLPVVATDENGATDTGTVQVNVIAPIFQCGDTTDNDSDGFIDTNDSACHTDGNPLNPNSYDPSIDDEGDSNPPQCSDSTDNDGDDLIDGGDPECHFDDDASNPDSYNPNDDDESAARECSDSIDNDGDRFTDIDDSACHTDRNPLNPVTYDPEIGSEADIPATQCTDSVDNDGDGVVDGGDPECHTDGDASNSDSYDPSIDLEQRLYQCSDEVDNDTDDFIDSADSACHTDRNPLNPLSYVSTLDSEADDPRTQCTDSVDNDGDGAVDGGDPECHTDGDATNGDSYDPSINSEMAPAPNPRCSDGIDNDDDGFIDAADSGCHTDGNPLNSNSYDPNDDDEGGNHNAQCSDSIDNDGDDKIDGGDPNCHEDNDPNNAGSYNPFDDTENDLDPGDDEDDDDEEEPEPTPMPEAYKYQPEVGHVIKGGKFSGRVIDQGRTVIKLAHERAWVDRTISVPSGDYWLFLNAKHDVPGPVDVGIYINGWPWKAVRLDKNDNTYRTNVIGRLTNFAGGTVRFRFLKDQFDLSDPTNAAKDRNLYIDWWSLTTDKGKPEATNDRGTSRKTITSNGEYFLPKLNQTIREELGTQHVNFDIWHFYAARMVAYPTSTEAINSELRLREVMRYWKAISPNRPRGI